MQKDDIFFRKQPALEVIDGGGLYFTKMIPDFQRVTVRGEETSGVSTS